MLKQKDDAVKRDETQPLDVSTEQGHLNGVEDHLPPAELSPSLRRSTRASALKAQEKIKSKDGTVPSANMVDSHVVSRKFKNFFINLIDLRQKMALPQPPQQQNTSQHRPQPPTLNNN